MSIAHSTIPEPAWLQPSLTLAEYYRSSGRLPRMQGELDEQEAKAGRVLRVVRRRAAGHLTDMPIEQRTWLDENVPGWLTDGTRSTAGTMRGTRSFEASVEATARFVRTYDRLPSARADTARERRLGKFLSNCRQSAKGKGTVAWPESKRRRLDRLVPGWDQPTLHRAGVLVAIAV